jgi:hypothetical protein
MGCGFWFREKVESNLGVVLVVCWRVRQKEGECLLTFPFILHVYYIKEIQVMGA